MPCNLSGLDIDSPLEVFGASLILDRDASKHHLK